MKPMNKNLKDTIHRCSKMLKSCSACPVDLQEVQRHLEQIRLWSRLSNCPRRSFGLWRWLLELIPWTLPIHALLRNSVKSCQIPQLTALYMLSDCILWACCHQGWRPSGDSPGWTQEDHQLHERLGWRRRYVQPCEVQMFCTKWSRWIYESIWNLIKFYQTIYDSTLY